MGFIVKISNQTPMISRKCGQKTGLVGKSHKVLLLIQYKDANQNYIYIYRYTFITLCI